MPAKFVAQHQGAFATLSAKALGRWRQGSPDQRTLERLLDRTGG